MRVYDRVFDRIGDTRQECSGLTARRRAPAYSLLVESRPSVVAVVPAYRPDVNLPELVQSLAGQVSRVVVVDDGSPSGADALDDAVHRGAEILRHGANRGIAAALNTGVHAALSTGDTVAVLTVDQDSQIPDGYVRALLDTWERAEGTGRRVGLVAPEHVSGLPDQRPARAPVQSGLLIPTATLRRVGDFDESLVIDGVDDDFALRCLDAGLALVVADGVRLGHRLGETDDITVAGRTIRLTRSEPFRYYYLTRNRIRLTRRHGRRHPGWSARQLIGAGGHLGKVLAFDPQRSERLREAWRGARDGLRGGEDIRP
jgi:rhamnosyltransferase